jgi:hypothetical protein
MKVLTNNKKEDTLIEGLTFKKLIIATSRTAKKLTLRQWL